MNTKSLSNFSIPFLISGVIAIVLMTVTSARTPLAIAMIILGAFIGTVFLDLEYIIYAFFLEPEKDFSKTLTGYIKHFDLINAEKFIQYHRDEIKDKTLNSVIFQIILVPISFLIMFSGTTLLIKTLILTTYANSIYRMLESYYGYNSSEWFWALKEKPNRNGVMIFSIILIACLVLVISSTL